VGGDAIHVDDGLERGDVARIGSASASGRRVTAFVREQVDERIEQRGASARPSR
jgi:hypothetical protein